MILANVTEQKNILISQQNYITEVEAYKYIHVYSNGTPC